MKNRLFNNILLSLACCLFFSLYGSTLLAQDCGDKSSTAEVTLTGIGEVTVEMEEGEGSRDAIRKYKQVLADTVSATGLATCNGGCTIGSCEMQFSSYSSGSSTPSSSTNGNGDYVFQPPSNGDLTFSVHCPCVVHSQVYENEYEYEGGHHGGRVDEGDNRLIRTDIGNAEFKFFPNPADEKVNIDIDLQKTSSYLTLSIVNLQGHVLTTKEIGTLGKGLHRFDLDIRALSPGLYFGLIHLDNEVVSQSRIVIQH